MSDAMQFHDESALLQELMWLNEQNAQNLGQVAVAIEDRGLYQVLQDFAFECEHFTEQLSQWAQVQADSGEVNPACYQAVEQSIANYGSRESILAYTENAEQSILDRYEYAMQNIERPEIREMLREQYEQVQDIHDWVHRVRLVVAA